VCCDGSDARQFHVMQAEKMDEAKGIARVTRRTPAMQASFMHVGERARDSGERVFWRGSAMLILNRERGGKGRERGDRATN
jgi:hypothetical protein